MRSDRKTVVAFGLALLLFAQAFATPAGRTTITLNDDWKFIEEDVSGADSPSSGYWPFYQLIPFDQQFSRSFSSGRDCTNGSEGSTRSGQ